MSLHAAIKASNTAAITGAGLGGIGYALAKTLGSHGLNLSLFDNSSEHLSSAQKELVASGVPASKILTTTGDVASAEDVKKWSEETRKRFGNVHYLALNAGVSIKPSENPFDETERAYWETILGTNLGGVINGGAAFVKHMMDAKETGAVVITGSKQGITAPPGNPAYNVSKAAVKTYAEALAHQFLTTAPHLSAHLLVPGWTYTKLTGAKEGGSKPEGAWYPEQVVDYFLPRQAKGNFYVICPDNDVTEATDKGRMAWSATDAVEGRPALSRWNPKYKDEFEAHMKKYT